MTTIIEKAHTVGSTFPPLTPGTTRLYSMRFCPYSQRVRLVLAAKNVPFETVNINMKRKPEWYAESVIAQGHVPCIQHDDSRTIYDSLIICEYLDGLYPTAPKLIPNDPYERAKSQMLVETFQRVAGLLFKALKYKDAEAYNEINKVMDTFERALVRGAKFFGGAEVGLVDYMIWPWFERLLHLKSLTNYELDDVRFVKLCQWVRRMLDMPAVKKTMSKEEHMLEYYKASLITNQEPDYDLGLE